MEEIVLVPTVIPRIENEFRVDHQKLVLAHVAKLEEKDKNGDSGYPQTSQADMALQQMSDQEKHMFRVQQLSLPRTEPTKNNYVDKVKKDSEIKNLRSNILETVELLSRAMEDEAKYWQFSEELRQLSSMYTDRGKKRFLSGQTNVRDNDPVQKYQNAIR